MYAYPEISPDGTSVLFSANTTYEMGLHETECIYMWRLTDNTVQRLSKTSGESARDSPDGWAHDTFPCWSPDGSRFAYIARSYSSSPTIVIRGSDGHYVTKFELSGFVARDLSWHPTEEVLLFTSYTGFKSADARAYPGTISALKLETGNVVSLTGPGRNLSQPRWRSGIEQFVCVEDYRTDSERLVLLDAPI